MAKMTLLAMVQNILSEMESDPVNSITDTAEAMQVAEIIRTAFYNIVTTREWPHLTTILPLTSTGDATKTVHLFIPDRVDEINWIKYDKRDNGVTKREYANVKYVTPEEMLSIMATRDSDATNVDIVADFSGVELLVLNDKHPDYFTLISSRSSTTGNINTSQDEYVVFDSYDSATGSTIIAARTMCEVRIEPSFTMDDDFVPDFPSKNFPYLLAEAKSVAFNIVKQMPNGKEEQWIFRHRLWSARNKNRANKGQDTPNYGRKGRRGGSNNMGNGNLNTTAGDSLPSWWPS